MAAASGRRRREAMRGHAPAMLHGPDALRGAVASESASSLAHSALRNSWAPRAACRGAASARAELGRPRDGGAAPGGCARDAPCEWDDDVCGDVMALEAPACGGNRLEREARSGPELGADGRYSGRKSLGGRWMYVASCARCDGSVTCDALTGSPCGKGPSVPGIAACALAVIYSFIHSATAVRCVRDVPTVLPSSIFGFGLSTSPS